MASVIGIDLGGTKIAGVRYESATWKKEAELTAATEAEHGIERILAAIVALTEKLKTPETSSIGIGMPGLIAKREGRIVRLPNIPGAEGCAIGEELTKRIGLPVSIENDANCFTLAEAMVGAGKGHDIVVGITLGTGVGGGIVINGKLYNGSRGFAAEIGHMLLMPGQPPFTTRDKRGDVEQFLSGTAMGKRCTEAKRPEDYLEGEVCSFLRPEIFRETAWLCTNLMHLLDPSIIVFGGSAGKALKPHLGAITKELNVWMLPGIDPPPLAIAKRNDAGTLGAALIAGHS